MTTITSNNTQNVINGINLNRSVYHDTRTNLIYKIWDVDYIHSKTFTKAIKNKFFDNNMICCFDSIIFDDNKNCRGYITKYASRGNKQLHEITDLFNIVKYQTKQTGFFINDMCQKNIRKMGNKYTLIDIEEAYSIKNIIKINDGYHIKIKNEYYEPFRGSNVYLQFIINECS
jgi:hypothetical protein